MTELTFQFVPLYSDNVNIPESIIGDGKVVCTSLKEGGVTSVVLREGDELEFSKFGSVRYTVRETPLKDIDLKSTFDYAKKTIQNVLQVDVSNHVVCLLISDSDSVGVYLKNEDKIDAFSKEMFDECETKYSEMNNSTIKIGFKTEPAPKLPSVGY